MGDGVVCIIVMGFVEGLKCGLNVIGIGVFINVLVGIEILGCIMDVLGNLIDECGLIGE